MYMVCVEPNCPSEGLHSYRFIAGNNVDPEDLEKALDIYYDKCDDYSNTDARDSIANELIHILNDMGKEAYDVVNVFKAGENRITLDRPYYLYY